MNSPTPFGIAKVISCSDDGDLKLQWVSNTHDSPEGTFQLGWTAPKKIQPYYADEKIHANHRPYMASDDDVSMNQRDVLLHSFQLTDDNRLPQKLLTAISDHDCIWWTKSD